MLGAFNPKELQNFKTVLKLMKRKKLSVDDTIKEIENRFKPGKQTISKKHDLPINYRACSECGEPAVILAVNTGKGNMLEDLSLNSIILCQNIPSGNGKWKESHCGHEEFSKKNVPELTKNS